MAMREVLFIGGPADQQWLAVSENAREYEILKAPNLFTDKEVEIEKVLYVLHPVGMFGDRTAWFAVPSDMQLDDERILYSIFQRDIANYLIRGRR